MVHFDGDMFITFDSVFKNPIFKFCTQLLIEYTLTYLGDGISLIRVIGDSHIDFINLVYIIF